jgi:tetratricopeptide (TPR) repeat protein
MARRAGAGRFVLGEITEAGGRLRITATLHRGNAPAVPATAEGDAEGFVALVDQLASKLRAGGIEAPLTRIARAALRSTGSEPARQAYLQGEAEYHAGRYAAAAAAFGRAAELDTTFALAFYRLSVATHWNGQDWLVRQAAARAEQQAGRLLAEDRLLIRAWNAYLAGEALQAETMYRSVLAAHPDETDAWFYLGETLFHWMPMLGRPAGESRPMWERVLRDDPNNVGALIHLARVAAGENRQTEFEALLMRLLAIESGGDQMLEMRAVRAFAWGTRDEQAAIARELVGRGDRALRAAVSSAGVHSRNLAGAERLARPLTASTWDPEGRAGDYLLRAQMEMGQGRLEAAGASLDSATALSWAFGVQYRGVQATLPFVPARPAGLIRLRQMIDGSHEAVDDSPKAERIGPWRPYLAGLLSVRLGDVPNALRSVDALARSTGTRSDSAFGRQYARVLESEIARLQGDPRRALAALGEPRLEPDGTLAEILSYPKAQERWLRAELLRELGRHQEALRIYGSFPDPAGYDLMYLAPSHLRRAEILEGMGQQREAAWHYARFVDLWKDADPALRPLLSRAAGNVASRGGALAGQPLP